MRQAHHIHLATAACVGVGLLLLLIACRGESELDRIAHDACAQVDGAVVLVAAGHLSDAVRRAEEVGASAGELGEAMREQCSEVMGRIDDFVAGVRERDALPAQVTISGVTCRYERQPRGAGYLNTARGTVTNNSDVAVDVFIGADFYRSSGLIVDQGSDSISRLQSGDRARFEVRSYGEARGDRCRAYISSAHPAR